MSVLSLGLTTMLTHNLRINNDLIIHKFLFLNVFSLIFSVDIEYHSAEEGIGMLNLI
jgi:hypothetical protein